MNESLRIGESFEIDEGLMKFKHTSNRLLGIVETKVYDQSGRLLTTTRTHNDVVIPGSVFILEQMFKQKGTDRRLHPTTVDTKIPGIGTIQLTSGWVTPTTINNELIFGFMVGNGGASSEGVHEVSYSANALCDKNGTSSFLPFRIVKVGADQPSGYMFKATASDYNFYYIKGFDTTPSVTTSADGCYASMKMSINSKELKEYFNLAGITANIGINQIGLVAGYCSTSNKYDDIKLVTTLNFPFHDLSGTNSMDINYSIYSMQ